MDRARPFIDADCELPVLTVLSLQFNLTPTFFICSISQVFDNKQMLLASTTEVVGDVRRTASLSSQPCCVYA